MPKIFDNIADKLLPALQQHLANAERADFCVGYFNLRGWRGLASHVDTWAGQDTSGACCRLLIGMQRSPQEELQDAFRVDAGGELLDLAKAQQRKRLLAEELRDQLQWGVPSNADEAGLRQLAAQIRAKKVVVKLHLRHTLHAKLYLLYENHHKIPVTAYMGSSNLTVSGLARQGELNVDVVEQDAAVKLVKWFEDRWNERFSVNIGDALATIIETSWARETPIPPYDIYLKMLHHLSQDAEAGNQEYTLPKVFKGVLFAYQEAAVKLAARHLHRRGGVIFGDVVGLGKTIMATATAKMFEELGGRTLIICPANLKTMWDDYVHRYDLHAHILSFDEAKNKLPDLKPYRTVLVDESHNLRNRTGVRYKVIQDYITQCSARVILLTATPYNKSYTDLSAQLRLFLPDDYDLGVRPEQYLSALEAKHQLPGEAAFEQRHTGAVHCVSAFEHSTYADDWRELLRLFMVRRTRSFIMRMYAETDPVSGRKFLPMSDGTASYFPTRKPITAKFAVDPQYEMLYSEAVVDTINNLCLPRYGLGKYADETAATTTATAGETKQLADLGRAGKRLMGFCRTNLFKRLESSGRAFVLSVERHLLRNYVFLHALTHGEPVPIGTQTADLLDSVMDDRDTATDDDTPDDTETTAGLRREADFAQRAAHIYAGYRTVYKKKFRFLPAHLFTPELATDLQSDCAALLAVLGKCADWRAGLDQKLAALWTLAKKTHPKQKILVFTQFADTAEYLAQGLADMGVSDAGCATGQSGNVSQIAAAFSPVSNGKRAESSPEKQLRVLIATDVLSEGQNLQDAHIVVNYDLPWAIIRLIQRAGRVDRIGQQAATILCYSFLPADGVENIIRLRGRVTQRLGQNGEVVGSDELFFEDQLPSTDLRNLYNEAEGLLDGAGDDAQADTDTDLVSYAHGIWTAATKNNPALKKRILDLPNVVYSAKAHVPFGKTAPDGVLAFVQTGDGSNTLAYVDKSGAVVSESQYAILKAAECAPDTPAVPRGEWHHDAMERTVKRIVQNDSRVGASLGRASGARFKTYETIKRHAAANRETLFDFDGVDAALTELLQAPLTQGATDVLNMHLRNGANDAAITNLVLLLRDENRLCVRGGDNPRREPRILCSLGLVSE